MSSRTTRLRRVAPHVHDLLDLAAAMGLTKQETPGMPVPEVSTDRTTLTEVPGGCSHKSAR